MPPNLHMRVTALEQSAKPELSLAERLKAARDRRRAMTPEEREADALERLKRALAHPEPMKGTLPHRLWLAARRMAIHRGLLPSLEGDW